MTRTDGEAGAGAVAHADQQGRILTVPNAISVARLGQLDLVALPGEPYHQLGVEIRRDRRGPVLLLGYTNGYIGYIPTREAYASLDYEILVSPLAAGAGERLRDAATQLLASSIGGSK